MKRILFLSGLLAAPAFLLAAEPPPAAATAPAASPPVAATREEDELITVDFPSEPIRNIIRNVADLFELNVVIPDAPELQANVSIKLRNVTWRQIFSVVLTPIGFTSIEEGNIIKIVSRDALAAEPTRAEILPIQFSRAADIAAIVTPMLNPAAGERIQVDGRGNLIILTIGPTRSREINETIRRLDENPGDSRQVVIETKFIEANINDIRNLGVNWQSLSGYRIIGGPFGLSYREGFDRARSDGFTSDIGTDNRTTNTNTASSGVNNTITTGTAPRTDLTSTSRLNTAIDTVNEATDVIGRLSSLVDATTLVRASTAVFNAQEFAVIISALSTGNNVRLVSNPTVVSLSNEEAKINVTTKFPIVLTTQTPGAAGPTITETKQDEEFGITLKVTPQVRPQNLISLAITPEVSNLDGFNVSPQGNRYPIISRRAVTNRVNLRDGYTIALGGLVQTQVSKTVNKVPVLGDIPAVGRLFRSDSDSEVSRNLIVFITARIIDAAGNTQEVATQQNFDVLIPKTVDPRMTQMMGIQKQDLPGFRPNLPVYAPPPAEGEKSGNP